VPGLRPVSGEATITILTKEYDFAVSGQSESHIRFSKQTPEGKAGTVVPLHRELKIGTLRGILRLAKIDPDDFARHL
jgi:predicted RNA binding protein YcfA (HicA-like mRNA interferase family)